MSPPQRRVTASLVSSGLLIAALIAVGRVTGFAREAVLVGLFGLTEQADVAVLSLTLPDLLVGLLISGGLSAALIPEFKARGSDAGALFWQASLLAAGTGLVVALAISLWRQGWVSLLAPGLAPSATHLAGEAFLVVAWAVPLAALSGVSTAFLNSQERFGLAAAGTLIFNGVVIAALLLSLVLPVKPLAMLIWGVLAAAAVRWLPQLWVSVAISGAGPGSRWLISGALIRRYAYGVAASSALVLLPLVARALASLGESGAITAVNMSIKLVELPLGAAIAVLPTLFLPRLSEKFLDPSTEEEGYRLLTLALRVGMALIVAVTVPAILFMPSLVQLLLGHGQIQASEVERIAGLARLAFCYFPLQALILILAAGFNARRDTWIPMMINGVVLGVFLVLGITMVDVLGEAGIMVGLVGAYAVSVFLSLLSFRIRYHTSLVGRLCNRDLALSLVAAMVIGSAAGALAFQVPRDLIMVRVLVATLTGGLILTVMLAASPEARDWVRRTLDR